MVQLITPEQFFAHKKSINPIITERIVFVPQEVTGTVNGDSNKGLIILTIGVVALLTLGLMAIAISRKKC